MAETLAVAWRRLGDVPSDDPIPWLFAVARNLWRNGRRRDSRLRRLAVGVPTETTAIAPDEVAVSPAPAILQALARLSHVDQEVLRLVVW